MRQILVVTATVLAVSVVTSTAVFAKKKSTDATGASQAQARESVNDSFNRCVALAKSRGFTPSDIGGKDAPVRNFVIRCMQGKQN
jgi:hypothetical protein